MGACVIRSARRFASRVCRRAGVVAGTLAALASLAVAPAAAGTNSGGMLAASDGHGRVDLFWFPPLGRVAISGWEVSEDGRKVMRVAPDGRGAKDLAALARLAPRTQEDAQAFQVLALRVTSDATYARSLALATTLTNVAPGRHRFGVTSLSGGIVLASATVDTSQTTPLPGAPRTLRASAVDGGVMLRWLPAPRRADAPALAFAIERQSASGAAVPVTAQPLIAGVTAQGRTLTYLDRAAPLGATAVYRVYALDLFGRRGPPATVSLYVLDLRALGPPFGVTATSDGTRVVVRWTPRRDPHTAGYIVERSALHAGPYTPVQRRVFGPQTSSYDDANLQAGTDYFYRVIAVGARGDLGPPSRPAAVQIPGSG
ncbi:MAG: fibronectin type III domain-containing protein, partial [Vulcanimicrobiaceae bacterium]